MTVHPKIIVGVFREAQNNKIPDMAQKRVCSIADCGRPHYARGWCNKHWARWIAHGDPLINMARKRGVCSIDGCGRPHNARGWCVEHYDNWRTHGDPLWVWQGFAGERNPRWVGDNAGYATVHKLRLGDPTQLPCVDCGKKARHWSYDHKDPDELISDRGSSKGMPYSLKNEHYQPRCARCHKRFDNGKLSRSDIEAICAAYAAGERQQSIADRFGISRSYVSYIVNQEKKEKEN